jgi:hypothetical protein
MSEHAHDPGERAAASDDTDRKTARDRMGDGIKQGIGVLSALRDSLEESIQEARERGLSTERAREVVKEALDKAQAAGGRARERLDLAQQADVDSLRDVVASIGSRLSRLDESVFGRSAAPGADPDGPTGTENAAGD